MPVHPAYHTPTGLTDEMRDQLGRQRNVVLATISDDGSPHVTELFFLLDEEDRIQMPTPHTTRKFKNLQQRPVACAFFYDQPGWISATGPVELWTGARAAAANQRNRDRLLTEAGHETIGRVLAVHEDATIVLAPQKWLSWRGDGLIPAVADYGGDLDAYPPETWFENLG